MKQRAPILLNLNALTRDARCYIWKLLNPLDRALILCAHNSQRRLVFDSSFFNSCAEHNYDDLFLWGVSQVGDGKLAISCSCFSWFCFNGNLSMVQWYLRRRTQGFPYLAVSCWLHALKNNHFHILEYLLLDYDAELKYVYLWEISASAAFNNNRAGLQWCIKQGYDILSANDLPVFAIKGGHADLAWELVHAMKCNTDSVGIAIASIECGCWRHVFPWLTAIDWQAVVIDIFKAKALAALKWIHENTVLPEETWKKIAQYYVAEPWPWRIPEFETYFIKHGHL